MRVGFFGGSFDPIHRGHVATARAARAALALDRVVFLPTARPPHKPERLATLAPAHARFTMVELALLAEEGLYASAHELTLDRPAYTVETLEHFAAVLPDDQRFLLLGSDSLATLHTWRRWRDLPELATLAVLTRPGHGRDVLAAQMHPESRPLLVDTRVAWVDNPPVAVSATAIRTALLAGAEPPAGSLDPAVLSYIRKYELYQT